MNREYLSKALCEIDESFLAEAYRPVSEAANDSSERIIHMKKKRIITFALAAALVIALGVGAYAAGLFGGKPEIITTPVDRDDPAWEDVVADAPYVNEMQYVQWAPHNNLPTAEIEALLAEIDGKEEYSDRTFTSVSEMEKTYGIELLKLGKEECNVHAGLAFCDKNDHSAGGHMLGGWNSYEDGVYLSTMCSYLFNSPYLNSSQGRPLTKIESTGEYEIKSLGVTASLVSGLREGDGTSIREIDAFFSYGGIDYSISAILDHPSDETLGKVNADWLCAKLETLQTPSWVSETAGPVPERPSDEVNGAEAHNDINVIIGFDAEEAGPSGVILRREAIDHDDPNWEEQMKLMPQYAGAKESLFTMWAPHGNQVTTEIESMLKDLDEEDPYSYQPFDSVAEMAKFYGIELLCLGEEDSDVLGSVMNYACADFTGTWKCRADELRIDTMAIYTMDPELYSSLGSYWMSIDDEAEYEIRSLGLTARLVSGLRGTEDAERCVMAFFSCGGVDYCITATADEGQDISIAQLCALLETLHY